MNEPRNAAAVAERFLHDVLAGRGPASLDDLVANANLRDAVRAMRHSFGELSVTPHVIVSSGDYAAVHLTARGIHRGLFQGVPATGRSWTAACSAVYRVQDGRIVDAWVTWDELAILEQIGGVHRSPGASA